MVFQGRIFTLLCSCLQQTHSLPPKRRDVEDTRMKRDWARDWFRHINVFIASPLLHFLQHYISQTAERALRGRTKYLFFSLTPPSYLYPSLSLLLTSNLLKTLFFSFSNSLSLKVCSVVSIYKHHSTA